jgi:predicted TIM-barrel fold metal-dependent hydrolase
MADRPGVDELTLRDYRPRSMLRVPVHHVRRPRFAAIDAHSHLGPTLFAGDWAGRDPGDLTRALDKLGMAAIVNLDGGHGEGLRRELDRWAPVRERVAVFATLDYPSWAVEPRFGEAEARRLREGIAHGAAGLKVWKMLGLRARDATGRVVAVDDRRLDPLWAAAGELGVPVTIHVADPIAFFEPLDAVNERWEELRSNPDWHFWPTRPAGRPDLDGFPPFDELIDELESIVVRHPATTFIGAHVGCAAEDLARVSVILERCPNFHVDLAARLAELGRQPYTARAFFLRWADRILYGTDGAPEAATHAPYARFLETFDESFDYGPDQPPGQGRWQIHGIGLPDEVLEPVYSGNARRLIRFG